MNEMVHSVPLVVDVDGTLIKSDLLHESVMQFVAHSPHELWRLPLWLAGGKARLKAELSERAPPDMATIPLRQETMDLIGAAQAAGRPVYLASASDKRLVEALAERIGGISRVFGSDGRTNVAGGNKARLLDEALGKGRYDYIGDRPVDFGVWPSARRVLAVSHSGGFARKVMRRFPEAEIIASPRPSPRKYLKAMRPHQWSKNSLVFLSLIAGHHFGVEPVLKTLLAFACFCCAASSAYLFNDLLDLSGDRAHPRKRNRPFASGDLPIAHGVVLGALLMAMAVGGSLLLPRAFTVTLLAYVAATLAYSFYLKRKMFVDVIMLAGLYTIRVVAGIAAIASEMSQWLLMFSLFLFMSLATVKRCSELVTWKKEGKWEALGRSYRHSDLAVLLPLGAAAAFSSVLVFSLYLASPEVTALYGHPMRLWLMCPLLLCWLGRILLLANRDQVHDDPIIFAFNDKVSWLTGFAAAAIVMVSI